MKNCFTYCSQLYTLILKYNEIYHLVAKSFYNLLHLRFLDLSNNPITFIPDYSFMNMPHLSLLNITKSLFKVIGSIIFENVKLSLIVINTNYYVYCVSPANTICTIYPPWYVFLLRHCTQSTTECCICDYNFCYYYQLIYGLFSFICLNIRFLKHLL